MGCDDWAAELFAACGDIGSSVEGHKGQPSLGTQPALIFTMLDVFTFSSESPKLNRHLTNVDARYWHPHGFHWSPPTHNTINHNLVPMPSPSTLHMTVTAVKFPGQNVDVASHFPPLILRHAVVCVFGSNLCDLWWSA